jgi:Acetyltransferase (GNAT) domain
LIHTLNPLLDPRWQAFLDQHPRASIFHSPGWLRALFETYGYSPVVYTTTPPNLPLENGIVFALVKTWLIRPRLVSLPFSDHTDPLVETQSRLVEMLSELQASEQSGKWKKIELRPTITEDRQGRWLPFQDGTKYVLHRVDLRPGLEEVFAKFQRDSIRRKIRKAERSNIREEVGQGERQIEQFFALHTLTRRRKSLPPPPIAWFRNIVACLGNNAKIRVALKDSIPIAAILTLRFKDTAVYKYGCTDSRFHNLGAMPFLLWRAMEEEFRSGAKTFDLGRSEPENAGLIQFKEKFGAESSSVTYKVYPQDAPSVPGQDWRLTWSKWLFRMLPEKALVYAGERIYPHIG